MGIHADNPTNRTLNKDPGQQQPAKIEEPAPRNKKKQPLPQARPGEKKAKHPNKDKNTDDLIERDKVSEGEKVKEK